jgi:tetratricopeptide (TPR) repeat protein
MSLGHFLSRLAFLRRLRSPAARTRAWEVHFQTGIAALREGKLPDAERAYARALDEAEGFPPGDVRLTVTLDNLAGVLRMEDKFREAEPLCRRTLGIKERLFGPDSPNVASTLKDLAEIHRRLGNLEQASAFNRRALAILEKVIGPDFAELEESLRHSRVLGDEPE